MNGIHGEQAIFQRIRINLLMILVIVFSCEITFAAENITIETKTGNFFENLVSDTLLLLDPDLKKIIADDFDHVVTNSKFELPVNSWKPRPNPKIRLAVIYDRFNSNNVKESLASLVQPVVEIACSPQKHDPLSEYQSKCIKEMFGYPIIQSIEIKYTYDSGKTKEQYITDLTGLNNSNRYQQIVRTTADIMNSVYEKVSKKNVAKNVNIIKNPLKLVAVSSNSSVTKVIMTSNTPGQYSPYAQKERQELLNQLNYLENNSSIVLNCSLREKEQRIEKVKAKLAKLENNPTAYMNEQTTDKINDAEDKMRQAESAASMAEMQVQEAERKQRDAEHQLQQAEQKQRDAEQKQRDHNIWNHWR